MKPSDFRFFHHLRVRWAEVDMQKIVFNGHYLMYLDTAVADYWRAVGLPYEDVMHRLGGDMYVVKATLEYKASARYDDRLQVGLKCERIGNSSIIFKGGIFCDGKLLVTGELVYVYANPVTQTSLPVPSVLRDLFTRYEAGEAMTHIVTGNWQLVGEIGLPLRYEVFVDEQKIPAEFEQDEWDVTALHALVLNGLDMPIGVGRLLQHAPGVGRIGRMAVKRVMRGADIGTQLLNALIQAAKQRGDHSLLLHAQVSAIGFYAKLGFQPHGARFEEAGIEHQEMHLHLV